MADRPVRPCCPLDSIRRAPRKEISGTGKIMVREEWPGYCAGRCVPMTSRKTAKVFLTMAGMAGGGRGAAGTGMNHRFHRCSPMRSEWVRIGASLCGL